jgi:ATP-binding cassette subfamily B protein
MASMPPTPELLDAVERLPPADARPAVDPAFARASDDHFRLRNLLSRFRLPFAVGLILVALDALCGLALPVLIRDGIDQGVNRGVMTAVWVASVLALGVVLVDWVIQSASTRITGRTGERFLYTLRVKIFSHLQRLGLDYYERELGGRILTRMTTDVDALSSFLQTGLVTAMVSLMSFFGILIALCLLDLQLMIVVGLVLPVLVVATLIFRGVSGRRPAGERRGFADQPGVPPRALQRATIRRAVGPLPANPDPQPALHLDLLPVRPVPQQSRRGTRPGPGGRPVP